MVLYSQEWVLQQMHELYKELQNIKTSQIENYVKGRLSRKSYNIVLVINKHENNNMYQYSKTSFIFSASLFLIFILILYSLYIAYITRTTMNPYTFWFHSLFFIFFGFLYCSLCKLIIEMNTEPNRIPSQIKDVKNKLEPIKSVVEKNKALNVAKLGEKVSQKTPSIFQKNLIDEFLPEYEKKILNKGDILKNKEKSKDIAQFHTNFEEMQKAFRESYAYDMNRFHLLESYIFTNNPNGFIRRIYKKLPLRPSELEEIVSEFPDEHKKVVRYIRIGIKLNGDMNEIRQMIHKNNGSINLSRYIQNYAYPEANANITTTNDSFASFYYFIRNRSLNNYNTLYQQVQETQSVLQSLKQYSYDPLQIQSWLITPVYKNFIGVGPTITAIIVLYGILLIAYTQWNNSMRNTTYKHILKQPFEDIKYSWKNGNGMKIITLIIGVITLPTLIYLRLLFGKRYENNQIHLYTDFLHTSIGNLESQMRYVKDRYIQPNKETHSKHLISKIQIDEEKFIDKLYPIYKHYRNATFTYTKNHLYAEKPQKQKPFPLFSLFMYLTIFIATLYGFVWLFTHYNPTYQSRLYTGSEVSKDALILGVLVIILLAFIYDIVVFFKYYTTQSYESQFG